MMDKWVDESGETMSPGMEDTYDTCGCQGSQLGNSMRSFPDILSLPPPPPVPASLFDTWMPQDTSGNISCHFCHLAGSGGDSGLVEIFSRGETPNDVLFVIVTACCIGGALLGVFIALAAFKQHQKKLVTMGATKRTTEASLGLSPTKSESSLVLPRIHYHSRLESTCSAVHWVSRRYTNTENHYTTIESLPRENLLTGEELYEVDYHQRLHRDKKTLIMRPNRSSSLLLVRQHGHIQRYPGNYLGMQVYENPRTVWGTQGMQRRPAPPCQAPPPPPPPPPPYESPLCTPRFTHNT